MPRQTRLSFAVLCTVPFIMVLGNSMLLPLIPQIKGALHLTLAQAGLIITAFSVPAGLTIPLAGFLSDHVGRKRIMAPALLVYGLGGLVAGGAVLVFSAPFPYLLAGRIIQGFGAGGTYQLAMALTGDTFQSRERTKALGLLEAANGLGKVVSPVAGAALGLLAWYAPFFVYGLLAIPVAIAVWILVKEPDAPRTRPDLVHYLYQVGLVFRQKGTSLLAWFLAGMVVLLLLFGNLSFLADLLEQRYSLTGIPSGLLIAIPVGAMALSSYASGSYLQGQKEQVLDAALILGLAAVALALATLALVVSIYLTFAALVVMGAGSGTVLPAINTLITGAAGREERGIITCLYGSMRFLGVALGPPLFGLITQPVRVYAFAAATAAVLAILGLVVLTSKRKARRGGGP